MEHEEFAEIRAYLACEGLRLDSDVLYWQDEYRRFPLASVANSLALATARREIFNQLSHIICDLLGL